MGERADWFIDRDIKIEQDSQHFRFNSDTVLLARFMKIKKGESVLDIGTNNGVLLAYAARKFEPAKLTGVEVLQEPARLAAKNLQPVANAEILNMPVQQLKGCQYDVILSNPPFFSIEEMFGDGLADLRQLGRVQVNLTLGELLDAVRRLLKDNGRFYLVYRPEKLNEIYRELSKNKLTVKRMQFAIDRRDDKVKTLLLEIRKGSLGDVTVLPPVWIGDAA